MESILTLPELATFLKVSEDTIYRLISDGKIEAIKVGSQWRFTEEQVKDYLDSRTIKVVKRKQSTFKV